MEYADRRLSDFRFFKAETFFESFENSAGKDLLSMEEHLASFSDCILIFLESPGAQTELGAFTVKDKLARIVLAVNSQEFQGQSSFISDGPLKKLEDISEFGSAVYANFSAILVSMPEIKDRLLRIERQRGESVNLKTYDSYVSMRPKNRMLFIYDIISLFSPIKYKNIIEVLKKLYGGKNNYDIEKELSLLQAIGFLSSCNGQYIANQIDHPTFYRYKDFSFTEARSRVIRHYFKHSRDALASLTSRVEP